MRSKLLHGRRCIIFVRRAALLSCVPLALPLAAQTNSALSFNGVNQYVSVTNFGSSAPTNEVTVEFWAYVTQLANQSPFALEPGQQGNRFLTIFNNNTTNLFWDFGNANGAGRLATTNPPNTLSNWTHYAFVASQTGNFMRVYVNGQLHAEKAGMDPFARGSYELRIGGNNLSYNGQLDEFRVWNAALSQPQILANLNFGVANNAANLLLYYRFNEGAGVVASNSASVTAPDFNGTLVNGPAWLPSTAPVPITSASFPVSPAYTFSTLAGYGGTGSADGVGSLAQFNYPRDVAVDASGNIFVADSENNTIRKITAAGVVTTIAGLAGNAGTADGINSGARFKFPIGIAVDGLGRAFVADQGANNIRMLTPVGADWVVTTIVRNLNYPTSLTVDTAGNVFFINALGTNNLQKATLVGANWVISTVPNAGLLDGTNNGARFSGVGHVNADDAGNFYLTYLDKVRKLIPNGINWELNTLATVATGPQDIALAATGEIYVSDQYNQIQKLTYDGTNWAVSSFAGATNSIAGSADGTGSSARFAQPIGLAVDSADSIIVCDVRNSLIRRITSAAVVSTVAGAASTGSADGVGAFARFSRPEAVAVDNAENVFVADRDNATIRRITSAGVVSTVAGLAGNEGFANGAGSLARFRLPSGVTVSSDGNVYVADTGNNAVRKITPAGLVTTIASSFFAPYGIAAHGSNTIFVSEQSNHTIRKLVRIGTNWMISTVAGLAGNFGSEDGTNTAARFTLPSGVTVDADGNLYVADTGNHTIRKVTPEGTNWVVSTIAGLAGSTVPFDDGVGSDTRFSSPRGVAVDGAGNLYVTDSGYNRIRKMVPVGTNWVVTTIGGLARTPENLDASGSTDGAGTTARFASPGGIATDTNGNLFVADSLNKTIRKGVFTPFAPINQVAYINPPMNGRISVTLMPPEANGQWRFPWELGWHNSGFTALNLVAGNYPIEFRNVPGWIVIPLSGPATLSSGATLAITNNYYPTLGSGDTNIGFGSLTVFLGVTPPAGSGWRFLGESTAFFPTAFTTNLLPGTYLIEFAAVSGRVKPPSQAVQISPGQPSFLSVNYLLAATPPANVQLPVRVPANQLNDETTYPFGFNGQLQSDIGYGSGVAVQTNVVLTAAHLVFNDQTLSYVNHAYWFFRRDAGVSEPLPQEARGFYVLSGYAAQRTNDLASAISPDESTPPSRNRDVAALYFAAPVAAGGYGGYLPSDAVPNTWLASSALKMLVGYPVDGSQFGDASILPGKMYQTSPQSLPLALATDPVPDQQQVYVASWFLSYPGNSGGPLYVQFNGYFYPAAIYLGSLLSGSQPYASIVRAIDSNVVNLITRAAAQGDSGTNFTGGGVITIIPSQSIDANHAGAVQFVLTPPSAVRAGAGWRLQGDPVYSNAPTYTRPIFSTNAFAIEFKPIPGWNLPSNQSVFVSPNQLSVYTAFYTVTNPALFNIRLGATNRIAMTGTTGTMYRLERKGALTNANWLTVSTNTINSTNFNFVLTNPSAGFYRLNWITNF